MPFFVYNGRNARGEMVRGVLEGADSSIVADLLFNNGITPIEILLTGRAASETPTVSDWWKKVSEDRSIKPVDVMLFSRQMYTLLKAGVPILRSLAGLQESSQSSGFAAILRDMRETLDSGRELSVALRRHPQVFSALYVSMVRVGEATGRLEEVFLRLFYYLEFEKNTRDQIKSALRYPIFVLVAMAVAVGIINIFVIPAFSKVYASFKAELPLMTRILVKTSEFTVQYWPMVLGVIVIAFVSFKLYVGTASGKYRWDRFKLRLPVVGSVIEKATLARFTRSFALASKSGVPVVQGLSVVSQVVDNDYIASRIEQMRNSVERGESILRSAITMGIFTPIVLQMIAVGEETGELDGLLQEVSEMYERDVEYEVKNLSAKIEPVLIIALAVLVLILALGVFLPIWDLGQAAMHGGRR